MARCARSEYRSGWKTHPVLYAARLPFSDSASRIQTNEKGRTMPGALEGIRVLDLCIILAGPTCGRTLSEYGAEVIKVDPEHRVPGLTPWLDVGRGKRSICLNITRDAGLEAFYRLADTSDVLLQGFRKGVAERLGIGYEQLSERNPGIVYASINAFGQEGDWAMRPGFDQNAQAATGMQLRNGGDGQPGPPPYTFNDYGTGIMAAYGVMLALLEREHTGRGQKIDTSLAYTASTFSSAYMVDYEGYEPDEVSGPEAKGFDTLNRLYRTADGWLALSVNNDGEREKFNSLGPFTKLSDRSTLEPIFASRSTDDWVKSLSEAGIAATASRTLADVRNEARDGERDLIVAEHHPFFGSVEHGTAAPQMDATPVRTGTSPVFGGDTVEVLTELGHSDDEIEAMRADGVIPQTDGLPLR
ncbi:MAG: CoA transferase [Dehalococcoidia bacterium]|nr:CoA transferase [Dehalococcoidia bacterium]